jgi:hypothetical protein
MNSTRPSWLTHLIDALRAHPDVRDPALVGSRATGDDVPLSDWDVRVHERDFPALANDLPTLIAPTAPLAQQWDRLSDRAVYMLMLPGAEKVDLIFDEPNTHAPPWDVTATTLPAIDAHFWDWALWLAAKVQRQRAALVVAELGKMHHHLLAPLGVPAAAHTLEQAIATYTAARDAAARRLNTTEPSQLETAVRTRLREHAFDV